MADKEEKNTKKSTTSKQNTAAKKETTKKEVVKKNEKEEVKTAKQTSTKSNKNTKVDPKKDVKKDEKKEINKSIPKETKKEETKTTAKVEVKEEKSNDTPKGTVTVETKKFNIKNSNVNNKSNKSSASGNNKNVAGIVFVIAVIAIVALLTVLIITSSDPKKSVDGYLTNLKAGEFEKAQEFTTGDKLLNDTDYSNEIKRLLFDKLSWKVKKVTTDNNNATVEIEITNKDFSQVLQNWTKRLLNDVRAVLGKTVDTSKYFEEELKNEDLQTKTTTGTIKLEKQDKKWKVIVDSELENILLPELESSLNYVQ